MAKIIIVGSTERKGSFCPQCRRRVPKESRTETGINCPRCGFFRWDEFSKYKSLDGIPVPDSNIPESEKVVIKKLGGVVQGNIIIPEKEDVPKYICLKCNRGFRTQAALNSHIRYKHSEEDE